MTNDEKADLYDDLVHKGGLLERKNSKLRSEHALNMSDDIKKEMNENQRLINEFNQRLNVLINS